VPTPPDLAVSTTHIEIRTAAHHDAVNEIVAYLMRHAPELQNDTNYWFESFCYWVGERWQPSALPENTLVAEKDNANLLTKTLTGTAIIREDEEALDPPSAEKAEAEARTSKLLIPHEPLLPTPEPLLIQLIHEVQRHILVDEQLVRRIYHALLAGHVILTGPPGTGKTELARLIPEILWQSKADDGEQDGDNTGLSRETAYTTRMVTATDDWSPRTLISGIVPQTINGTVSYKVQYGHLAATILKNWSFDGNQPEEWSTLTLRRTRITTPAGTERGTIQTFKGQWLVIDEFNRAPIDLALGDALTALGGNDVLRVPIDNGSAELPIPQDFRIIGTLNSFDRHYLNQIGEALKRRFSFVEILPPTRAQRSAEQGIVLYKALKKVSHLSPAINVDASSLYWDGMVAIEADASGQYALLWEDENASFPAAFKAAWRIFEIIRIYRQLGTAQAIGLIRHMLIAGILQDYQTYEAWCAALDAALCDTIADQLQVLLPDEIETLFLYLTTPPESFVAAYHQQLNELATAPQRLYGQLRTFSNIVDDDGILYLSDADIERIVAQDQPTVTNTTLQQLFHLNHERPLLPQFIRRLRMFKAERGL
jgi:MoxR-like ATPase